MRIAKALKRASSIAKAQYTVFSFWPFPRLGPGSIKNTTTIELVEARACVPADTDTVNSQAGNCRMHACIESHPTVGMPDAPVDDSLPDRKKIDGAQKEQALGKRRPRVPRALPTCPLCHCRPGLLPTLHSRRTYRAAAEPERCT